MPLTCFIYLENDAKKICNNLSTMWKYRHFTRKNYDDSCGGNTMEAVQEVVRDYNVEVIDLLNHIISPYDYEHKNKDDDFIRIAEKLVETDIIVFATPVYWYSMSSQLKIFFDRLSDLLNIRKDIGRALKGKICYLVASGTDKELPDGFEVPFRDTCKHFGMRYKEAFYFFVKKEGVMSENVRNSASKFGAKIFSS